MIFHRSLLLAAAAVLGSAPVAAHSPYLLPNYFDATGRDHVSVQASFTERFFVPDEVMKAGDYHAVGPDGARAALVPMYSKDVAILDVDTKLPGTYRISTGLREGTTRKAALVKGQWEFFEAREAPANAVDMQSWTRADVYVSRGAPTDRVLAPTGLGLELQPLVHPNRLHAGASLRLRVLFDGKPLAGQSVALQGAVSAAGDSPAPLELRTGADGSVEVPLSTPGVFQVQARQRVAPAAADAKGRSYTIALTFDVSE